MNTESFDRKTKNAVKNANRVMLTQEGLKGITELTVSEIDCPDGFRRSLDADFLAPFLDAGAGKTVTATRIRVVSHEVYPGVTSYKIVGEVQTTTQPKPESKATPKTKVKTFLLDAWTHATPEAASILKTSPVLNAPAAQ